MMKLLRLTIINNITVLLVDTELPSNEEARQAVVRELVNTESIYIRHLTAIVEVSAKIK